MEPTTRNSGGRHFYSSGYNPWAHRGTTLAAKQCQAKAPSQMKSRFVGTVYKSLAEKQIGQGTAQKWPVRKCWAMVTSSSVGCRMLPFGSRVRCLWSSCSVSNYFNVTRQFMVWQPGSLCIVLATVARIGYDGCVLTKLKVGRDSRVLQQTFCVLIKTSSQLEKVKFCWSVCFWWCLRKEY